MRKTLWLLAVAALAALAPSCRRQETLQVAFIGSATGKLTTTYSLGMNALDLYVNRPDAAKGFVRYEIVVFDDKSDIANLDGIVAQILERKIRFLIGPYTSSFAARVKELIKGKDILEIAPVAALDTLERQDDNFIKLYPGIKAGADRLATYAGTLGLRKIVPVQDLSNQDYGDRWIASFQERLAGKVEVAEPITFRNPTDLNYSRISESVLRTGADAILLVTNTFDGSMVCQMLRKADPSIVLVCSSWPFNAEFLSGTGKSSEGALFSAAFDGASQAERYLEFKAGYKARFLKDVTDFISAYCYEAIELLDQAIGSSRSTDPAKVKAEILKIGTFHGLQGDFTIDSFGDAQRPFVVLEVKGGKYIHVE